MLGLISFLSTTVFFSPVVNLALLPFVVYRLVIGRHGVTFKGLRTSEKFGLGLLLYSLVLVVPVFVFGSASINNWERSILGPVPYLFLVVASIFVGFAFDRRDLVIVLLLVFVEVAVGLAEYVVGVHSFFGARFIGETGLDVTELLYFKRVYGLSLNSSGYAFKVLIGFVIVMAFKAEWPRKWWLLAMGVLGIGFATSFGRTAVAAALVGLVTYYAVTSWKVLVAGLVSAFTVGIVYSQSILENLTLGRRGFGDIASERAVVYEDFLSIIRHHPLFGNAARKVWVDVMGRYYHAHNSYLELIASNGAVISAVFLLGYYLLLLRGRLAHATPVLVYSLLQYGVFWGLVFHDIAFSAVMIYLLRRELQAQHSRGGVLMPRIVNAREGPADKAGQGDANEECRPARPVLRNGLC